MVNAIKELLGKKKTIVALAGIILTVISKYTWAQSITEEQLVWIIGMLFAVLGVGIAIEDVGKAKAKIENGGS